MQKKGFYRSVQKVTSKSRKAEFAKQPHAVVMKVLKGLDPQSLSSHCAAHIAAYLEDTIYHRSATDKTWRWDGGRFYVRQAKYKDEMRLLKGLCIRLQYSAAINDWLTEHTGGFAEHIRQDKKLDGRIRRWSSLTIRQRENLVYAFMKEQAFYFSRDGLPIALAQFHVAALSGDAGAYCTTPKVSEIKNVFQTQIVLGENYLKERSPRLPLSIVFHEGIHNISWRLALGVQKGEVKPGHPLYEDAALRRAMLNNRVVLNTKFGSLYRLNCEEKLAYAQQSLLEKQLFAGRRKSLRL